MSRTEQRRMHQRRLSLETLESRRLLVVGVVVAPPQNFANPEDTNYDGVVSPADALIVINALNRMHSGESAGNFSVDVDGDGVISPRDALLVINRLNNPSPISGVPPQQRAVGLRQAIDAGYPPPNMTPAGVQELLETLEQGGYYERGDRFRNGQMINLNTPSDPVVDQQAEGESNEMWAGFWQAGENTLPQEPAELEPLSVTSEDPLGLFEPILDGTFETLHAFRLLENVVRAIDPSDPHAIDRLAEYVRTQLADHQVSSFVDSQISRVVTDANLTELIAAIQRGETSLEQLVVHAQAAHASWGNLPEQISQLFANLDVAGIVEQVRVDLNTIVQANRQHLRATSTREAIFADLVSRVTRGVF